MDKQQDKKPRAAKTKRSWSRVELGLDDGYEWTFWLTPAGLHVRRKHCRRTDVMPFTQLRDEATGQKLLPM